MAITDLDEQLLVRAHQAGDEQAFGQIVRSQHRALYAHAYRRLGNHEAAEDAVQDTLLRAYRALPSFDGDLRLRAWLHRILTNVCHDESNRRRRAAGLIDRLEAQPVELAPDPIEETVLHDTVRVMTEALAELPESYREALVLRYVDGLSFREVADATGISEENARARVHRGRLALNKVMSRMSMLVAFLIPGLRRTQKALDTGGADVASSGATEPTVHLSTQIATHVANAAPLLNRVAAESSSLVAAKTSAVATAVAAVAAMSAPVVAYKVYDTNRAEPRPAAVAAPAETETPEDEATQGGPLTAVGEVTATDAAADSLVTGPTSTSTTSSSTSSTLPRSAVAPFVGDEQDDDDDVAPPGPTTTTAAPPEETEETGTTVHGGLGGDGFLVEGTRPDFSVNGRAVLQSADRSAPGALSGRVYVADAVGGDASTELDLLLDDGTKLRVRFRGTLVDEQAADGATVWNMRGDYLIAGGEAFGIAEHGSAAIEFRYLDGAPSSLRFDLQGRQQTD